MVESPQRTCLHLCVINELCRLAGVGVQSDNVMVSPMIPIHKKTMRRISSNPTQGEAQHKDPQQVYHPEINQLEEVQQQQ